MEYKKFQVYVNFAGIVPIEAADAEEAASIVAMMHDEEVMRQCSSFEIMDVEEIDD